MERKKFFALFLVLAMTAIFMTGCGSSSGSGSSGESGSAGTVSTQEGVDPSEAKIALITNVVGVDPFNLQCVNVLKDMGDELGFEYSVIEVADDSAWDENVSAAVHEGYTLIIGIGWYTAEPLAKAAESNPEVQYAVIDTAVEGDAITSYNFNVVEAAYVLGVLAGTAFPDDEYYGGIYCYETQAFFEYSWGYEQGVLSVNPDAQFIRNYTNSFNDINAAYDFAMQQASAGCEFIYGGAASGDAGIYQAALELAETGTPIYTNGQDVDETTPDNPYILSSQLKNTGNVTRNIIESYLNGTLVGGNFTLGIADGALDVVNGTAEEANYTNTDVITDEVRAACEQAKQDIIDGVIVLEVPMIEDAG